MPRRLPLALICCLLPFGLFGAEREVSFTSVATPASGALAVAVNADGSLGPAAARIDEALGGALARALEATEVKPGETLSLYGMGAWETVVLVGLEDHASERRVLEDFGGSAATALASSKATLATILWDGEPAGAQHIRFGAALGQYAFDRYKAEDTDDEAENEILAISVPDAAEAEAEWRSGRASLLEAVRFARDLVSEPSNVIYPQSFADRTMEAFDGVSKVNVHVLDDGALREAGMGALVGVGQGSERPPRLVAVEYRGAGDDEAHIAFVGKGITFDTGGISLKSGNDVWRMKTDMAGAAAAVGAVLALAGREARVNAVGIAALAENMPSGHAQRPGDVVRTGSGKTIEVINTDAEGRLVLADGVWYAQNRFEPWVLIDLATLTGSVITAVGDEYAGLFSRHDELARQLTDAAEEASEPVWRLPLHESYAKDIESPIADIKNISGHRKGGAGIGAQVIGTFVPETLPWAHLDIAGTAWADADEVTATVPMGATGWGIRLLDEWSRRHAEGR